MTTQEILSRMKVLALEMSDFSSIFEPSQIESMKEEYSDLACELDRKGEGIIWALRNIEEEVASHRARAEIWKREAEAAEAKARSLEGTMEWMKNTLMMGIIEASGAEDEKGMFKIFDGRKARIMKRSVLEMKEGFDILTLPQKFLRVKTELNKVEINKAYEEVRNGLGSRENFNDATRGGFEVREIETVRIY